MRFVRCGHGDDHHGARALAADLDRWTSWCGGRGHTQPPTWRPRWRTTSVSRCRSSRQWPHRRREHAGRDAAARPRRVRRRRQRGTVRGVCAPCRARCSTSPSSVGRTPAAPVPSLPRVCTSADPSPAAWRSTTRPSAGTTQGCTSTPRASWWRTWARPTGWSSTVEPSDGPTAIDGSSTIVLGSSTLRVRRGGGAGLPLHPSGDGRLAVRPPAAPIRPLGAVEVESPTAPLEPHRGRIPWLGALVPVPIGSGARPGARTAAAPLRSPWSGGAGRECRRGPVGRRPCAPPRDGCTCRGTAGSTGATPPGAAGRGRATGCRQSGPTRRAQDRRGSPTRPVARRWSGRPAGHRRGRDPGGLARRVEEGAPSRLGSTGRRRPGGRRLPGSRRAANR